MKSLTSLLVEPSGGADPHDFLYRGFIYLFFFSRKDDKWTFSDANSYQLVGPA